MNFHCFLLLIVCFCWALQENQAYEYCSSSGDQQPLCSTGSAHVVCKPDSVASLGDVVGVVPMTEKLKTLFLHLHNAYRNNTACGTLENNGAKFSKATRMRRLIWDYELAYIAQIHAERCNMEHDKCHNTRRFPMSGQNLAYQMSSEKVPLLSVTDTSVKMWYDEYKLVTDVANFAKQYPADQLKEVGHYTLLVNDRVSRVGCALTLCKRPDKDTYHYHTTCNYDYTNVQGTPDYDDSGDIGSKCSDWGTELSSEYSCLCENSGEIFKP